MRRPVGIATKLTISQPNDRSELEADQAAAHVFRMAPDTPLQRKCKGPDECDLHRKEAEPGAAAGHDMNAVYGAMRASGGTALDSPSRNFFEPRFGSDFSGVRLHSDEPAADASAAINARAFTHGSHIYFGRGEYRPTSTDGRHLLAHELAHVVQQSQNVSELRRASRGGGAGGSEGATASRGGSSTTSREGGGSSRGAPSGSSRSGSGDAGGRAVRAAPAALPCVVESGAGHFSGQNVMFGRDSSALSPSDQTDVDRFAKAWKSAGGSTPIRVDGYASVEGAAAYNLGLSCRRALAVRHELSLRGVPMGMITPVAHGETIEFDAKTLPPNRRAIISSAGSRRVSPPARRGVPKGVCGGINAFFREILLIDQSLLSDIVTCICFGFSIADAIPIPAIGQNPVVEAADCTCNILTLMQEVYKRGNVNGCWSPLNMSASDAFALQLLAALAVIDCGSVPIGDALGGFILGLFGTAAEPGGGTVAGGAAGVLLGDFIVDLATMAMQNYITQGTVLPVAQMKACGRLVDKAGARRRGTPRRDPSRTAPRQQPTGPRQQQPPTGPRTTPGSRGGGPEPTPPGAEKKPTQPASRLRCGPKVTPQVANAVAKTKSLYRGWSPTDRANACDALTSVPVAAFAWDIQNLHKNGWILWYRCPSPPTPCAAAGTGKHEPTSASADTGVCASRGADCGSTVEVNGQCYYAGSVNYVIFGTMASLCGLSEYVVQGLIAAYKAGGMKGSNYSTARDWAMAGYNGWPSGGSPPAGDRAQCEPTCPLPYIGWGDTGSNAVGGKDFNIVWCPKENPWEECKDENKAWESAAEHLLKGLF
jgi:outer membrane protein OmpA-like peptidoglycan-associated protein